MKTDGLKKAMENLLSESRTEIQDLLVRAKHVKEKGLKLTTRITMKDGDGKKKEVLAKKLIALITESKDKFDQLIVRVVQVEDKGQRTRITIV